MSCAKKKKNKWLVIKCLVSEMKTIILDRLGKPIFCLTYNYSLKFNRFILSKANNHYGHIMFISSSILETLLRVEYLSKSFIRQLERFEIASQWYFKKAISRNSL